MPKNGRGCKDKGSDYEREIASYLNQALFNGATLVNRTPLSGAVRHIPTSNADLTGLPDIHAELKRTERLDVRAALRQAVSASSPGTFPTVFTRQSRVPTGESLVVMRLDDWLHLYRAYIASR